VVERKGTFLLWILGAGEFSYNPGEYLPKTPNEKGCFTKAVSGHKRDKGEEERETGWEKGGPGIETPMDQ